LYANAHDETDDTRDPIKVKLPTRTDPSAYIWDNGRGLSKDDLIRLFTTYGASDKRGTNAKIGGFGVGSKVLFAYTDSFSATSIEETTYERTVIVCYKNAEGMPTVRVVQHGSARPNERHGLKIDWSVSPTDVLSFVKEFRDVTSRFKYQPALVGETPTIEPYEKYSTKSKDGGQSWALRTTEFVSIAGSGACVVMGGVPYTLDCDLLRNTAIQRGESFTYGRAIAGAALDIFVPVGAVQVAASREALSYDPISSAYLIRRVKEVAQEWSESYQKELDKSANQWEAFNYFNNLFNRHSRVSIGYGLLSILQTTLSWKGLTWNTINEYALPSPIGHSSIHKKSKPYNPVPNWEPYTKTFVSSNYPTRMPLHVSLQRWSNFIEDDFAFFVFLTEETNTYKSVNPALKEYMRQHNIECSRIHFINVNYDDLKTKTCLPLTFKSPTVVWTPEINNKYRPATAPRAKKAAPVALSPDTLRISSVQVNYVYEGEICWSNTTSMDTFDKYESTLPSETKWYYVKDKEGRSSLPFSPDTMLHQKLYFVTTIQNKLVYNLPFSQKNRLTGRSGWKNIHENVAEFMMWIEQTFNPAMWIKGRAFSSVYADLPTTPLVWAKRYSDSIKMVDDNLKNPDVLRLWEFYKAQSTAGYSSASIPTGLNLAYGLSKSVDAVKKKVYKGMSDIIAKKKLLTLMSMDAHQSYAFFNYLNDTTISY